MKKDISKYYFDESLKDIPQYPSELLKYTDKLFRKYKTTENPADKVLIMGELGSYLRQLNKLDEAESILVESLKLIDLYQLGHKLETQQKIRLANVLQWKKEFKNSTQMFSEIIKSCRINKEINNYLPFALQHSGKNLFDQEKYNDALLCFNEALELRIKSNVPEDQINSTKLAIKITSEKIKF